MSRIGKKPVPIPSGVSVDVEGTVVRVKGPRGQLSRSFHPDLSFEMESEQLLVHRPTDSKQHKALHGLTRALVANMVEGVSNGFRKTLELVGVGYRAEKKGKDLILTVGYSHPVTYPEPEDVSLTAPSPTAVVVEGSDKQRVGQVAAEIRAVRPPEPYKGKGIRYQGEYVRRKAGKTAIK